MLGFWIIITHLVGAYLTSSEYIQNRAAFSTVFALGAAALYMIPFIIFLPISPLSFIAILAFRFISVRFGLMDYIIWVRNIAAPRDKRAHRLIRINSEEFKDASVNQVASLHLGSIALHCIIAAVAIIVL